MQNFKRKNNVFVKGKKKTARFWMQCQQMQMNFIVIEPAWSFMAHATSIAGRRKLYDELDRADCVRK